MSIRMVQTDAERAAAAHEIAVEMAEHDARRLAHRPRPVEQPTVDLRHRFQSADQIIALPSPVEIIEGALWADNITLMVGESGAGKTFVSLDMCGHADEGRPWHGRETKRCSIAYLSFEGDAFQLRLRALREQGFRLDNLHILRMGDTLSPRVTRDGEERSRGELDAVTNLRQLATELEAAGKPPIGIVKIDTARAAMSGDENASEHVSAFLRACRRILATTPGAAVCITHHAGWQDGDSQRKRERGSSAWRGNVDATLYLEAGAYDRITGEAPITLRTLKARDGEPLPPLSMIRRRVVLDAYDARGRQHTSCIIVSDPRTPEDIRAEQQEAADAAHHEADLAVLRAMREHPDATSIGRLRPYVGLRMDAVSASVFRILRAGWAEEGRRGMPYRLTQTGLQQLGERV
jgi:uncharacterized protein YjhX (UPF0386 family)